MKVKLMVIPQPNPNGSQGQFRTPEGYSRALVEPSTELGHREGCSELEVDTGWYRVVEEDIDIVDLVEMIAGSIWACEGLEEEEDYYAEARAIIRSLGYGI